MGKTYHRNKPADVDRSHAFKPAKTKVRLNPRDVYTALDEEFDESGPMMPGESDDPHVYIPGVGVRAMGGLPLSQGCGRSVITG